MKRAEGPLVHAKSKLFNYRNLKRDFWSISDAGITTKENRSRPRNWDSEKQCEIAKSYQVDLPMVTV